MMTLNQFPVPGPGLVARNGEARHSSALKEGRDEKSVCYQVMPQPRKQMKRSKANEARWRLGEDGLPWTVTTRVSPVSDNYMSEPHGSEWKCSRDQHGTVER